MDLETRRLDELTSREVEFYLKEGGNLIFVPFGPISGHGAFLPMGIHAHWAHAVSMELAKRANGLVHPPVFSAYSGATRTFRGSISFPVNEQKEILKHIASTLYDQGFERTVLVAGTNPENTGGMIAVRELYDESTRPFWMIQCSSVLDHPEVKALWEGHHPGIGETKIGYAALRMLGRERKLACPEWIKEEKPVEEGDLPPDIHPDIVQLRTLGMVGFHYHTENNHGNHGRIGLEINGQKDLDVAEQVLVKSAEILLPVLESYDRYIKWVKDHPQQWIEATDRLDEI